MLPNSSRYTILYYTFHNITNSLGFSGALGNITCDAGNELIFKDGCLAEFGAFIRAHAISLGAAGLAIAFFQVS